eukprot:3247083-Alexandrium_andersonii.AAC.1
MRKHLTCQHHKRNPRVGLWRWAFEELPQPNGVAAVSRSPMTVCGASSERCCKSARSFRNAEPHNALMRS